MDLKYYGPVHIIIFQTKQKYKRKQVFLAIFQYILNCSTNFHFDI